MARKDTYLIRIGLNALDEKDALTYAKEVANDLGRQVEVLVIPAGQMSGRFVESVDPDPDEREM